MNNQGEVPNTASAVDVVDTGDIVDSLNTSGSEESVGRSETDITINTAETVDTEDTTYRSTIKDPADIPQESDIVEPVDVTNNSNASDSGTSAGTSEMVETVETANTEETTLQIVVQSPEDVAPEPNLVERLGGVGKDFELTISHIPSKNIEPAEADDEDEDFEIIENPFPTEVPSAEKITASFKLDSYFVVGYRDGKIQLWEKLEGEDSTVRVSETKYPAKRKQYVTALSISRCPEEDQEGQKSYHLLAGFNSGDVKICNLVSGVPTLEFQTCHTKPVLAFTYIFSPDSNDCTAPIIVVAYADNAISVSCAATGKCKYKVMSPKDNLETRPLEIKSEMDGFSVSYTDDTRSVYSTRRKDDNNEQQLATYQLASEIRDIRRWAPKMAKGKKSKWGETCWKILRYVAIGAFVAVRMLGPKATAVKAITGALPQKAIEAAKKVEEEVTGNANANLSLLTLAELPMMQAQELRGILDIFREVESKLAEYHAEGPALKKEFYMKNGSIGASTKMSLGEAEVNLGGEYVHALARGPNLNAGAHVGLDGAGAYASAELVRAEIGAGPLTAGVGFKLSTGAQISTTAVQASVAGFGIKIGGPGGFSVSTPLFDVTVDPTRVLPVDAAKNLGNKYVDVAKELALERIGYHHPPTAVSS
ncbi:hypothetical protein RUND412_008894 [Rhizina undulata]